jgi:hypothetical protein
MNNKILIPGVALGAVLIALAFVVAPVQEASAVHTTIQANTIRHFLLTAVVSPDTGANDAVDEQATWTLSQPFEMINATILFSADTGTDCDMAAANIRTNFVAEAGVTEINPAAVNAATDTRHLFVSNAVANSPVFGSTVLSIALTEGQDCDADSRGTLQALIETTGSLTTAPTAAIATITAAKAGGLAGD